MHIVIVYLKVAQVDIRRLLNLRERFNLFDG